MSRSSSGALATNGWLIARRPHEPDRTTLSDRREEAMKLPTLRSRQLLEGPARAPARAMLRAVGLDDEDFERPLIGIANTWTDATPGMGRKSRTGAPC